MLDLCDFGHFTVANNAVVVSSLEAVGFLWPVWGQMITEGMSSQSVKLGDRLRHGWCHRTFMK